MGYRRMGAGGGLNNTKAPYLQTLYLSRIKQRVWTLTTRKFQKERAIDGKEGDKEGDKDDGKEKNRRLQETIHGFY